MLVVFSGILVTALIRGQGEKEPRHVQASNSEAVNTPDMSAHLSGEGSSDSFKEDAVIVISEQEGITDYTERIQEAFDDGAEQGITVRFENNEQGDATYHLAKTLILPDGLVVDGNGVTLAYDSNWMEAYQWAVYGTEQSAIYRDNCIVSEGRIEKRMTSFAIDHLKFLLRDDSGEMEIPRTLINIGDCVDVRITNCEFSTYSEIQLGLTTFDTYTNWRELYIADCIFNVNHEGPMGGVWLRNFHGADPSKGAVIERCVFNNRSADEVLAIYAQFPKIYDEPREMTDIVVRNCEFYCYNAKNNPDHFITLGNTGITKNILFENNYIYMEGVTHTVIKMGQHSERGWTDGITVRNNVIEVEDVLAHAGTVIHGDAAECSALVEGNEITVNTKTGLLKNGIRGDNALCRNNQFHGNGFDTLFQKVRQVEGNTVDLCKNAFEGVLLAKRNVIKECQGNLAIWGPMERSDPTEILEIQLEGNEFHSSHRSQVTTYGEDYLLNYRIVLRDNILDGIRIWGKNESTAMELYDNRFTLIGLDEIKFPAITAMSGNRFYDLTGKDLVTGNRWPQGNDFNVSVAVGVVVDTEESFSADTSGIEEVIGYKKTAVGTGEDSWERLYRE